MLKIVRLSGVRAALPAIAVLIALVPVLAVRASAEGQDATKRPMTFLDMQLMKQAG